MAEPTRESHRTLRYVRQSAPAIPHHSTTHISASEREPFRGRIPELDGLRAIAVTLVFLNHASPISSIPQLRFITEIGWVGVDVFFVISGFLIAGMLFDAPRENYFRNFYIRRSLRILPLYYTVLVATLLSMLLWHQGSSYQQMLGGWGSPAWLFGFLGNVKTASSDVSPPWAFVPMWSLHVEEQFYLLFPPIVKYVDRRMLYRLLLAALIVAPLSRVAVYAFAPDKRLIEYIVLPCRLEGLAFGALIALRLRTGPVRVRKLSLAVATAALSVLAVAVFVLGGRRFDSPLERTLGYTLFSAAGAGLILWIILFRGTRATDTLNYRPLQYLGRISFGLYLLQTPLASALAAFGYSPRTLHGSLALAALCVALASLSWFIMERPILSLKDQWAPWVTARA